MYRFPLNIRMFKDKLLMTIYFFVGDCEPGFYTEGRECRPCRKGYYQPSKWQKACIPCPRYYTTSGPGATSQNDCKGKLPSPVSKHQLSAFVIVKLTNYAFLTIKDKAL